MSEICNIVEILEKQYEIFNSIPYDAPQTVEGLYEKLS